jgi:hypothetical protein
MSASYTPQLKLGTVGWESGFEQSGLYPEDLPQEWRLTYLSNECDRVAIPLARLDGVDEAAVEEWAEDTHAQFAFYLLAPSGATAAQIGRALAQLEPLAERLLGVVRGEPCPLQGAEAAAEVVQLRVDGEVALVETDKALSPMALRQLIEQLNRAGVETLLFVPGSGLVANLANAETIAALLG